MPPKKKAKPKPKHQTEPEEEKKPVQSAGDELADIPSVTILQERPADVEVEHDEFEAEDKWDSPYWIERRERLPHDQPPDVYPFSANDVGPDFTILAIGKRREGKSFLIRYLLYHMRHIFPRIYVFTNTRMNRFWQGMVPSRFVFDGLQEGVLQALIDQQREFIEYCYEHPEQQINPRAVVVFDDCISTDCHHMEVLKTLFYNGRHSKLCVFFALQYAKGLPPGLRENADLTFLFRLHSIAQVEACCENCTYPDHGFICDSLLH